LATALIFILCCVAAVRSPRIGFDQVLFLLTVRCSISCATLMNQRCRGLCMTMMDRFALVSIFCYCWHYFIQQLFYFTVGTG